MKKILVTLFLTVILVLMGCNSTKETTLDKTGVTTISLAIPTTITTACDHSLETIPGVEETCTTDGLTSGLKCLKCGKVFKEREVIPASHKMEMESIAISPVEGFDHAATYACESCGYKEQRELTSSELGLPIITISGSMDGISKETKVTVKISYDSIEETFETSATMKYQGGSSLYYPKHNYNIQFLKDDSSKFKIELSSGWGKESKYCLKANYVDFSQARNVVSGKLYGQIVKSREIDDQFNSLVNGGAIDGYPVVVYYGSEFQGIYTLNIPKDKWLFGMGKGEKEAIVMADSWGDSVSLKQHMSYDFSNGWDLEYCSTDDSTWVVDSFNEMMDFLKDATYMDYVHGINDYVNEKRAIDSMIYTFMLTAFDNTAKNILWVTYDGKVWTPSMYDMDGVMGLYWNGDTSVVKPTDMMPESYIHSNLLWEVMFKYKKYAIARRYFEIRESVMNMENIEKTYREFFDQIPDYLYDADKKKWTEVPSQSTNNMDFILSFMNERLSVLDKYFESILNV